MNLTPEQVSQIIHEFYLRATLPGGTGSDHMKIQRALAILNQHLLKEDEPKKE